MMDQGDLFSALPPVPAAAPPPRSVQPGGPIPTYREWAGNHAASWEHQAGRVRDRGGPGAERVAQCLEITAEKTALEACGGDVLAALKLRLAACQPQERWGVTINNGPIMAEVRGRLEGRIQSLESDTFERAEKEMGCG